MSEAGRGGKVLGNFLVEEHLGEGGMCHVFRARHRQQGYECALKLLKDEHRNDERIRDLFVTEADIALLVEHPNLIATYEAGEVDNRFYIAMELIEGGTLGVLVERARPKGIELPVDLCLFLATEILDGLHALHTASGRTGRELGLVHRDITPHNIFMSFDGRVILGDFGIAHIQAYGEIDRNEMLGKIGYLSPEMISGEVVDHRSDVFAVGIVLHELLTGTRLFADGSDEEIMRAIVDARVPRPRNLRPGIDRELEEVVMKALARRPRDRFESAEEMLYALEPFWSKELANPYAVAALMTALFRAEAKKWQTRRSSEAPGRA